MFSSSQQGLYPRPQGGKHCHIKKVKARIGSAVIIGKEKHTTKYKGSFRETVKQGHSR
jgi:hypothetical protein